MSVELTGTLGELRMVVQIKRKETGQVDEVELTSQVTDLQTHETLLKEYGNGRNTQHSE